MAYTGLLVRKSRSMYWKKAVKIFTDKRVSKAKSARITYTYCLGRKQWFGESGEVWWHSVMLEWHTWQREGERRAVGERGGGERSSLIMEPHVGCGASHAAASRRQSISSCCRSLPYDIATIARRRASLPTRHAMHTHAHHSTISWSASYTTAPPRPHAGTQTYYHIPHSNVLYTEIFPNTNWFDIFELVFRNQWNSFIEELSLRNDFIFYIITELLYLRSFPFV